MDALRFFAFLAVLLRHGPTDGRRPSMAGAYGLSMFFMLSAYLITELLLREKEQSGTIAWGLFFTRRALRIWPLYYGAIAVAVVIAILSPVHYWVSKTGIIAMCFFVSNFVGVTAHLGTLIGPLWSISVEEQFYLLWPPIIKLGGKKLAFITSVFLIILAGVWISIFYNRAGLLWYDTPVEFLFFAIGAIIAFMTRGRAVTLSPVARVCLVTAGLVLLLMFVYSNPYLKYGGAAVGCGVIFVAILGITKVPRPLLYLGRISYGLYVFHVAMLEIAIWALAPLRLRANSTFNMLVVDTAALLLCIVVAHFSYRYFEKPFLKIKERYAVVKSRPA